MAPAGRPAGRARRAGSAGIAARQGSGAGRDEAKAAGQLRLSARDGPQRPGRLLANWGKACGARAKARAPVIIAGAGQAAAEVLGRRAISGRRPPGVQGRGGEWRQMEVTRMDESARLSELLWMAGRGPPTAQLVLAMICLRREWAPNEPASAPKPLRQAAEEKSDMNGEVRMDKPV
jgi:hypothetical protein